jgi:hypothetical protein
MKTASQRGRETTGEGQGAGWESAGEAPRVAQASSKRAYRRGEGPITHVA